MQKHWNQMENYLHRMYDVVLLQVLFYMRVKKSCFKIVSDIHKVLHEYQILLS